MRPNQAIVGLTLFLCLFVIRSVAEPLNIMVDDLTFTRPSTWRWQEPTPKSSAVNRFVVPDSGNHFKVDIRFYINNKDATNELGSLKWQFPEAKPDDFHKETVTIGKQSIIYWQVTGTYIYQNTAPRPDQFWLGAAIPRGKRYIYVRIQGPSLEASNEVAMFKKMVEDAVREREDDRIAQ